METKDLIAHVRPSDKQRDFKFVEIQSGPALLSIPCGFIVACVSIKGDCTDFFNHPDNERGF